MPNAAKQRSICATIGHTNYCIAADSLFQAKGGRAMERKVVSTADAPQAIGPYSQAITLGDLVFCSGQIPLTPAGAVAEGDITIQTRQVLTNLKHVLAAAGSSL